MPGAVSRTRSLVGLTAVTHLASAAVAEFYHTKPDEDERQHPLRYSRSGDVQPQHQSCSGLVESDLSSVTK